MGRQGQSVRCETRDWLCPKEKLDSSGGLEQRSTREQVGGYNVSLTTRHTTRGIPPCKPLNFSLPLRPTRSVRSCYTQSSSCSGRCTEIRTCPRNCNKSLTCLRRFRSLPASTARRRTACATPTGTSCRKNAGPPAMSCKCSSACCGTKRHADSSTPAPGCDGRHDSC